MTTLIDQSNLWTRKTTESISKIISMLSRTEDYEKDFVTLAKFLVETDINPWGFMPIGWESSKDSAQSFECFLNCLHHAMVDDGDVCFVTISLYGPRMLFRHYSEKEEIASDISKRYTTSHKLEVTWKSHNDSNRFIQELIKYEIDRQERTRIFEEKRKEVLSKFKV